MSWLANYYQAQAQKLAADTDLARAQVGQTQAQTNNMTDPFNEAAARDVARAQAAQGFAGAAATRQNTFNATDAQNYTLPMMMYKSQADTFNQNAMGQAALQNAASDARLRAAQAAQGYAGIPGIQAQGQYYQAQAQHTNAQAQAQELLNQTAARALMPNPYQSNDDSGPVIHGPSANPNANMPAFPGSVPPSGGSSVSDYLLSRLHPQAPTLQYATGTSTVPDTKTQKSDNKPDPKKSKTAQGKGEAMKGILPPDTVPAMLSPGEAVLNRAAAEHMGRGNIQALNQLGLQKMMAQQGGQPPQGGASMGPTSQPMIHAAAGDADVLAAQMRNGAGGQMIGLGGGIFDMIGRMGSNAGVIPGGQNGFAQPRVNDAGTNLSNSGFQPAPKPYNGPLPDYSPVSMAPAGTANSFQPLSAPQGFAAGGIVQQMHAMGVPHYAAGIEEVMPMDWSGSTGGTVGGMPPAAQYAKGTSKVKKGGKSGAGGAPPMPMSAMAPPQVPNAPGALPPGGGAAPPAPAMPMMPGQLLPSQ